MTTFADIARPLVKRLPGNQQAVLRAVFRRGRSITASAARLPIAQRTVRAARLVAGGPRAHPASSLPSVGNPLELSNRTEWFEFEAEPFERHLVTVRMASDHEPDERAALVQYRFLDHLGRTLKNESIGKAESSLYGYFDYLPRTPVDAVSSQVVFTPELATKLHVGFRRYKPSGDRPVSLEHVEVTPLGKRFAFPKYDVNDRLPPRTATRLAVVADTFTLDALSRECQVLPLSQRGWKDEIAAFAPDLLFIESAWNGNDGEWLYEVVNLSEKRKALRELTAHARELGIPSLFWNKEDPPHFEDFLEAARLCDHVATTDAELISRYQERLGHDRVFALPFAVQQDLHSPRKPRDERGGRFPEAVFLGSWWAEKFDERRDAQEALLEGAAPAGLAIYDRYFKFNDHERYRFPKRWLPYVHGSLDYDRVLTAYRSFNIVLNVNTVTHSQTMFSRRALEAAACGAVVISNPSIGTRAALGDLVLEASTAAECSEYVQRLRESPTERDVLAHRVYRQVHQHHTWGNRMQDIARETGIWVPHINRARKISVVLATKRPAGANRILEWLDSINDRDIELEPIVITAFDPAELDAGTIEQVGARIEKELEHHTLGDSLNRGAELATGGYVAKVDDDDLYGDAYFDDLLLAIEASRADICGKQAHLQYLESADTTVLRYPDSDHRFTDFVCGSTLLMKQSVFEEIQFPSRRVGEDTRFLNRARAAGFTVYSADRFNYISMRRADLDSHTWQVDADELLASNLSERVSDGIAGDFLEI